MCKNRNTFSVQCHTQSSNSLMYLQWNTTALKSIQHCALPPLTYPRAHWHYITHSHPQLPHHTKFICSHSHHTHTQCQLSHSYFYRSFPNSNLNGPSHSISPFGHGGNQSIYNHYTTAPYAMYTAPQYTTANPNRCPSNANDATLVEQHPLHERRRRASLDGSASTSTGHGQRERRTSMSTRASTRRDGSQRTKFSNGAGRCAVAGCSSMADTGDDEAIPDDDDDDGHDDSIPIAVTNHSYSVRKSETVIEEGRNDTDHVSVYWPFFNSFYSFSMYSCDVFYSIIHLWFSYSPFLITFVKLDYVFLV